MSDTKTNKKLKPPLKFFAEAEQKKRKISYKACASYWAICTDQERLIPVIEAAKNCEKTLREQPSLVAVALNTLTAEEWKLYLRHTGDPEIPDRPYDLYGKELLAEDPSFTIPQSSSSYRPALRERFTKLPLDIKVKWFQKFMKTWKNVYKQVKKLEEEGEYFRAGIIKKVIKKCFGRECISRNCPIVPQFTEVIMPDTYYEYEDFPKATVLRNVELYHIIVGNETSLYMKELPVVRNSIDECVSDMQNEYSKTLLEYAAGLPNETLRKFLGFKRKYFFKLLKEDIFEKDYPSKKYPCYVFKKEYFAKFVKTMSSPSCGISVTSSTPKIPSNFDVVEAVKTSISSLSKWGYNLESSDSEGEIVY